LDTAAVGRSRVEKVPVRVDGPPARVESSLCRERSRRLVEVRDQEARQLSGEKSESPNRCRTIGAF